MAKKQTRRSLSLSAAMHTAVKARAAAKNMSAAQYLHECVAVEMRTAGVEPPPHVSAYDPHNSKVGLEMTAWRREHQQSDEPDGARLAALKRAEIDEIAEARRLVAGRTGRNVFKAKKHDPLDADSPPPTGMCAWCHGRFTYKRPCVVIPVQGPHHADCHEERQRVERRTGELRRHA